jgi:hypothetical protein
LIMAITRALKELSPIDFFGLAILGSGNSVSALVGYFTGQKTTRHRSDTLTIFSK